MCTLPIKTRDSPTSPSVPGVVIVFRHARLVQFRKIHLTGSIVSGILQKKGHIFPQ
jgi:hypothetical protein